MVSASHGLFVNRGDVGRLSGTRAGPHDDCGDSGNGGGARARAECVSPCGIGYG